MATGSKTHYSSEELEPLANEAEYKAYNEYVEAEKQEEQMLIERFEKSVTLEEW